MDTSDTLEAVVERLARIETVLDFLVQQRTVREFYSTCEVAKILGKAEFTVREWCRLRRIAAQKKMSGHGKSLEWSISHTELLRIQNEGLLPLKGA
jgi:hypothetical protein